MSSGKALAFAKELARALDARLEELPFPQEDEGQWVVVDERGVVLVVVQQYPYSIGVNANDGSPLPQDVAKAAKIARAGADGSTESDVSPFELALAIQRAALDQLSHATTIRLPAQGNRIPAVQVQSEACYVNLNLRRTPRAGLADAVRVAVDDIAAQIEEHERALVSIVKMEAFAQALVTTLNERVPSPDKKPWSTFASCVPKVRHIEIHWSASHLNVVADLQIEGGHAFVRVRKWRVRLEQAGIAEVIERIEKRLAVLTRDRLKREKRYRVLQTLEGCEPGEELIFTGTEWEHDRFEVFLFERANGASIVLRDSAIVDDLEHYLEAV